MTSSELAIHLGSRVWFIDRHRPLLFWAQVALFTVGAFFYIGGITDPGVFKETTWGSLAYERDASFWGAANAISAFITALGLVRPVKNKMIAFGAVLQVMQFSAIAISCISYGGDIGIGMYASVFAILHCKIAYEAVKGL